MIDPTIPGPRLSEAPAVGARPTTAQLLAGRVLYQENARFLPRLRDCVDAKLSGVVMTGKKADERASQLREAGYRGVLLIDSAAYMTHTATPDEPFLLPQDSLFNDLDNCLTFQLHRGADVALTPTGYIPPAASKVLKAVMRAAKQIERDDVVVVLPVDIAWLNPEHIAQFIAACTEIRQPKAVILTRQFDPLKAFKEAPANLRRLVSEVEHIALLRTDLAALDAMTYGALFAGIGADSSIRHAVPAGERPQTAQNGGGAQFPSVLLPNLMRFSWGPTLANRYANAEPVRCDCPACQGRGLDRFNTPDGPTRIESEDHNAYTWGAWVNELAACSSAAERRQLWRDRCAHAVGRYELENVRIEQPRAFQAPPALKAWASLPTGDDTPAPAEGGPRGVSSAAG
ncbi:hypothetical protein SAMN05216276_11118 [Streptosporangium subroseum]|uniref:tRNA-guanine family transglycosylase n=1 Tax=Streptosporangium subroseum TaxID=106412 RepID=A0A239PBT9_9ACTN|nr:hypothetical protein [Streptosporangium subroseum]SNT64134.1 hypothetical protein SAMN05216276_11118 [Streptosporangium subroseum]